MAFRIIRQQGIPVVAYSTSDETSDLPCLLLINVSQDGNEVTLSLQFSLYVYGFDTMQTFTLLYHGDNLVKTSLGPVDILLPQDKLERIQRHEKRCIKTLSLTIKEHCPIWCPRSSGTIASKRGFENSFCQFVELAKATDIHVVFDLNWLQNHEWFNGFIGKPETMKSLIMPTRYTNQYRTADWKIFSCVVDAVPETPPPCKYKRYRDAEATPTPELPPLKRVLLSPGPVFAPSPTEKATSPIANEPDSQEAIENTVEKLLPEVLQKILPDMLPRLFVAPPLSPSLLPSLLLSTPSTNPNLNPLTSLGTLLSAYVAAHAEPQLKKIRDSMLEDAEYLRKVTDMDFLEEIDNHKLDVNMTKDAAITEINDLLDKERDDLRDSVLVINDEVVEHAELVYSDICKRLDGLSKVKRACIRPERKMLEREKEILQREEEILKKEEMMLKREEEMLEKEEEMLEKEEEMLRKEEEMLERKKEMLKRKREMVKREREMLKRDREEKQRDVGRDTQN